MERQRTEKFNTQRKEAFLGYGVVHLTDEGEWGLTFKMWNPREPTTESQRLIQDSLEQRRIAWDDPQALIVLVVKKEQIDVESLRPDLCIPGKPEYEYVKFEEAHKALPRYMTGGNHRQIGLKVVRKDKKEALDAVKMQYEKVLKLKEGEKKVAALKDAKAKVEGFEDAYENADQWLVEVSDYGEWNARCMCLLDDD